MIESCRRGYALELAVDFVRMKQEREPFWKMDLTKPLEKIPNQSLSEVVEGWPKGDIAVRAGDYMMRPHQRWTVKALPEAGGYLGGPYYKIEIAGTQRALAATADAELTTVKQFTGADEQLWRIEQLTDGTFRIMPKVIPGQEGVNTHICLYSAGDSTPTLAEYDFNSDNSKWNFRNH
jgi:arabinan endo-1,5-alpha-L-arabinosidase